MKHDHTQQPTPEEIAQHKHRIRRRFLRTGQALMIAGMGVVFVHWLAHLEAFGPAQPEGWSDLVAGYPMGALIILSGAMISSRKPR